MIGGAPAAAVVFAGEVNKRTAADPPLTGLEARIAQTREAGDEAEAAPADRRARGAAAAVRAEKLGEVAAEFDAAHSIERAQRVGSVH